MSRLPSWPQAHCRQVLHWDFLVSLALNLGLAHRDPFADTYDKLRATCIFNSIPKWEIMSLIICSSLRGVKEELCQE